MKSILPSSTIFAILVVVFGCSEKYSAESSADRIIAAERTTDEIVSVGFDDAMVVFNKAHSNFTVPSVFVFDNTGTCIARASSRDIYGEVLKHSIAAGKSACGDIDLPSIQKAIPALRREQHQTYILLLTDTGEHCTPCTEIISQFHLQILAGLDQPYTLQLVDIGITEKFPKN